MKFPKAMLVAPVAALGFLALAACGESKPPAPVVPPTTATPESPAPASPDQSLVTPNPADPTDGQALPPASPPPVLPETPPT